VVDNDRSQVFKTRQVRENFKTELAEEMAPGDNSTIDRINITSMKNNSIGVYRSDKMAEIFHNILK
jgi:hypothetical protein